MYLEHALFNTADTRPMVNALQFLFSAVEGIQTRTVTLGIIHTMHGWRLSGESKKYWNLLYAAYDVASSHLQGSKASSACSWSAFFLFFSRWACNAASGVIKHAA